MRRLFCCLALIHGLLLWQTIAPAYAHNPTPNVPSTKASKTTLCPQLPEALQTSWTAYKTTYIQDDGRVRDPNADNISTSESQAYGMLRAVWMDDKKSFDSIYDWTKNNLIKPNKNGLPAWKWGKNDKGQWTTLDTASASDADEDMALALLMAYEHWGDAQFKQDALQLLNVMWHNEIIKTAYGPVLSPGDWVPAELNRRDAEKKTPTVMLNPSYFSPLSYRVFAYYDTNKKHRWDKLIDSSYDLLDELSTTTRTGLPPNWFNLHLNKKRNKGAIQLFTDPDDQRSDYGYDAIRVHWRIGMDYLLTGDKRAAELLQHSNFIDRYWAVRGILPSPLTIDGIERNLDEILYPSNAIYGATLPHLTFQYPHIANTITQQFILDKLNSSNTDTKTKGIWEPATDYYAQNWLWLGLVGYNASQCTHIEKQNDNAFSAKPLLKLIK
jgi:endoglucanase